MRKDEKPMPLILPMIMFWGLPTRVAELPMLAEVARAIRKGPKGRFALLHVAIRAGVRKRQTVSFTRRAERTPEIMAVPKRRETGVLQIFMIRSEIQSKNLASLR